jgi:hypothetical protein
VTLILYSALSHVSVLCDVGLKCYEGGRRPPTRLIYWYGNAHNDLQSAFSFNTAKAVCSYEDGCAKGYNKIPHSIQAKIDKGVSLSASDKLIVEGLKEMEEERALPKAQRVKWLDFQVEQDSEDDVEKEEQGSEDEGDALKQPAGKQKKGSEEDDALKQPAGKQNKKRKDGTVNDVKAKRKKLKESEEEPNVDVVEAEMTESIRPGKKNKKTARKHPREEVKDSASLEVEGDKDNTLENAESKKAQKRKKLEQLIQKQVDEERLMEGDGSDEEEDDGEDYSKGSSEEEDEDDDDADYKAKKKASASSNKKKVKRSSPIAESEKIKKHKFQSAEDKRISNEQVKFVQCEKLFLDDMAKLCTAVEVQNEKECLRLLECIEKNVDEIIPSFVQESSIGILLKNVRYVFEHIKPDEIVRMKAKALTRALKDIYEKKSQNAVQFTPKRSKNWKLKAIVDISQVASNAVTDKTPKDRKPDALKTKMVVAATHNANTVKKSDKYSDPIQQQSQEMVKSAKKTFSLASLLDPKPQALSSTQTSISDNALVAPVTMMSADYPKWLTEEMIDNSIYRNKDRLIGIKSLLEACEVFKTGKVNPHSIAYALEKAIFLEFGDNLDNYWGKINQVFCAIKGKKAAGTIVQGIEDGKYYTPKSVILIPKKYLWQSYEGETMTI